VEEQTKEYRLEIRIKNNFLLSAMEKVGIKTAAELSRMCGVDQGTIGRYLNLKEHPINSKTTQFKDAIKKIGVCVGKSPETLFPKKYIVETNKISISADFDQLEKLDNSQADTGLLEYDPDTVDIKDAVDRVLGTITAREEFVLKLRFGIDGAEQTLKEISRKMGISPNRVRQIEMKALRKLRHQTRADYLKKAAFTGGR